jgi:hypothetical protein
MIVCAEAEEVEVGMVVALLRLLPQIRLCALSSCRRLMLYAMLEMAVAGVEI